MSNYKVDDKHTSKKVLILIIMEDALRVDDELPVPFIPGGLNPYYNGRCSMRVLNFVKTAMLHKS